MRSTTSSIIVILAATVFAVTAGQTGLAQASLVVISDDDFDDTDWTFQYVIQAAGSLFSGAQEVSGGFPGSFRKMNLYLPGTGTLRAFNAYGAETYDPSTQGAIISIDYSEDGIVFPRDGAFIMGHGTALEQGGSIYRYQLPHITPADNWDTYSKPDLTAADFARISGTGPGNPNFSDTGGPITFGYSRYLSSAARDWDHGIDNWSFTLNVVPEPSSVMLWLIGGAICLLASPRRRRGACP